MDATPCQPSEDQSQTPPGIWHPYPTYVPPSMMHHPPHWHATPLAVVCGNGWQQWSTFGAKSLISYWGKELCTVIIIARWIKVGDGRRITNWNQQNKGKENVKPLWPKLSYAPISSNISFLATLRLLFWLTVVSSLMGRFAGVAGELPSWSSQAAVGRTVLSEKPSSAGCSVTTSLGVLNSSRMSLLFESFPFFAWRDAFFFLVVFLGPTTCRATTTAFNSDWRNLWPLPRRAHENYAWKASLFPVVIVPLRV